MKEGDIGRACSKHKSANTLILILDGKPEGSGHLGDLENKSKDNIKMDINKIVCEAVG
jgi:hypothetical protein